MAEAVIAQSRMTRIAVVLVLLHPPHLLHLHHHGPDRTTEIAPREKRRKEKGQGDYKGGGEGVGPIPEDEKAFIYGIFR